MVPSPLQEVMNLQVNSAAVEGVIRKSHFFLMFLSPNRHSGVPSSKPHTHRSEALSVAEDLGQEFQREVKARIRQRKHQYWQFSL